MLLRMITILSFLSLSSFQGVVRVTQLNARVSYLLCLTISIIVLGRLHLSMNLTEPMSITAVKHGMLLLDRPSGNLYLLDTSELAGLLQNPRVTLIYTFPAHSLPLELSSLDIKEVRSQSGNLLLLNTVGQQNEVTVLEYQPPHSTKALVESSGGLFDFSAFKMPM